MPAAPGTAATGSSCLFCPRSHGGGHAASAEAAVLGGLVAHVQLWRLNPAASAVVALHGHVEYAARQQGPFDRVRRLAVGEQLLDVAHQTIEVLRTGRGRQVE